MKKADCKHLGKRDPYIHLNKLRRERVEMQ